VRAHGRRYQVPRDQAFAALSERGGYPMAQANPDVPWPQIADQLNETVIQRAIQHDLRLGSRGMKRDANLLEEVFRLALKGRKGDSKVCLCDHGLRASWLREVVPLDPSRLREDPHLADLAGHLAESVAGHFLSNIPHLDVNHFPPRGGEPEVDFVLTIGARPPPQSADAWPWRVRISGRGSARLRGIWPPRFAPMGGY